MAGGKALRARRIVEARRRALEKKLESLAKLVQRMSEDKIREAVRLAVVLAENTEATGAVKNTSPRRELGQS